MMIDAIAQLVVVLTGLYLLVLGGVSLWRPAAAGRFLLGFARAPAVRYAELLVRLLVGGAFVLAVPRMPLAAAIGVFGWILVVSTAGLLLLPWRWHRRFAQKAVPQALRHLGWVGLFSLVGGAVLLAAVFQAVG